MEFVHTNPISIAIPLGVVAGIVSLSVYRYYMGSSRQPEHERKEVEMKLSQALQTVKDLEEKLLSLEQLDKGEQHNDVKEIRVWMDGAFDMMHYGHMNAFRQGRSLGTHLIVGVNSDETITACKGPPVCGEKERLSTVRGCKWVDEVVEGVPYVMSDEYLRYVIEKYRIDYVVHGDDPCIVDGKNVYESAIRMGKYLTIPRTEGISTTDIVGRMLLMTRDHHSAAVDMDGEESEAPSDTGSPVNASTASFKLASSEKMRIRKRNESAAAPLPFIRHSRFLTTSRTIRLFGAGVTVPKPSDKVVYLAGAWDMFHAGHIEILERARQMGDYVIVGVHNDSVVNQRRGKNLPIMNLHERVLSVLGCKWVDDVLIDAPHIITEEMIQSLNISVVVTGSVAVRNKGRHLPGWSSEEESDSEEPSFNGVTQAPSAGSNAKTHTIDAGAIDGDQENSSANEEVYRIPREMGILHVLPCAEGDCGGVLGFVQRIQNQRKRFTDKYQKKAASENQYYTDKYKK